MNNIFGKFSNKFLSNLFTYSFVSIWFGFPWLLYWLLTEYLLVGVFVLGFFLFFISYGTFQEIHNDEERFSKISIEANKAEIGKVRLEMQKQINIYKQNLNVSEHKEQMWRQLLKERASGFPSLFENIAIYEKQIDDYLSDYLRTKPHPAVSASELVKGEAKRRRKAEFIQKKTQSIIEYYESIAPFLLDFKEQEIDENEDALREYNDEEREDPVTNYLTKEEYRKLSSQERNQMALERYWKRPKSKWLIGRIYERYVGYIFEQQGYLVEYTGIFKGYEDLGRDLICTKGNEVVVIQCKYWSQFKTIFEKHIFQFFGTVFQYRDKNQKKNVRAIFYTTTELSELARRFASELKIELEEKFKMNNDYPCIKCNISQVDGSKIYHLPFDQQYDNVKIEINKGEFYCATIEEAERKGFRRAFRWKGSKAG